MGRLLIRRALVVLLFAALLAPVLEAFDRWDATPGLTGDTEFHVAVLALAAGLLVTVALVAVRVSSILIRCAFTLRPAVRGPVCAAARPACCSGTSPPPIPLRI
jgi:hypothetical protein